MCAAFISTYDTVSDADCRLDRRISQATPAVLESLKEEVAAQQAAQSTPDTVAAVSTLEDRAEKVGLYGWRPYLFVSLSVRECFEWNSHSFPRTYHGHPQGLGGKHIPP